jgi:hypothetical protein
MMERYQSRPVHGDELYVPIDPSILQKPLDPEHPMIILEKAETPLFTEKALSFAEQKVVFFTSDQESLGRTLDTEL